MSDRSALAVLGGDARQIAMARTLAQMGYRVRVWGLGECGAGVGRAIPCESWQSAVEEAGVIILPLPACMDGVRISAPLQEPDRFLRMTTLLDSISGRLLLGGRLGEATRSIAEQKGIAWIDYFDSEILQLKNAVPTAEGAIAVAMNELPVTIDGIHAAIIGYGRIGSLLAERLRALGAEVTVYARRSEQCTLARLHHHRAARLLCREGETVLESIPADLRVIFNTVPSRILAGRVLEMLPPECLLIDLASAPGGIDHAAARAMGLHTVWATALPGKCAPESAGRILAEVLHEILSERMITPTLYGKDG